jgi:predicted enzyme related to lactoylglutathione lyase
VLTHFIVVEDVARSRDFYAGVLGGSVVLDGEPTIVKLANSWIIINVGGGPTDDKPGVTLEPPRDRSTASAYLNIRVADIQAVYRDWSAKGADFLTPPKTAAWSCAATCATPTVTSSSSANSPAYPAPASQRTRCWRQRRYLLP